MTRIIFSKDSFKVHYFKFFKAIGNLNIQYGIKNIEQFIEQVNQ
jgi:hypothetical protein